MNHCQYCGAKLVNTTGKVCRAHDDLPAKEPVRLVEGKT